MIIQIVVIVLQVLVTGGSPRWGGGGGQRDRLLQLQRLPPPAILVSPHWTVHRQLLRPLPAIVCYSSWALLTPLRLYPFVDGVESLSLGAVAVVPEVTSQIVLVKNCSIWAKERIFFSSSSTYVEHLREGGREMSGRKITKDFDLPDTELLCRHRTHQTLFLDRKRRLEVVLHR